MKAAVISLGSVSSKMLIEAMQKYFEQVDNINIKEVEVRLGKGQFTVLYQGKPLEDYDCIYAKGSFRYVNILRSIVAITKPTTFIPFTPGSFTVCHDKLLTHLKLQEFNVSNPQTLLFSSVKAAKESLSDLYFPIIMKLPHGTHGKGVMFADSKESASSVLDTLEALKQPFIIQEYIEAGGKDIRAFVIGEEVIAAMQRSAVSGEKRANIHAGGSGEAFLMDPKAKKLAIDAAHAVGCEISAIDLLKGPKGHTVIEVNISPGLQGITKATGINVADKMAKYLFDKTLEMKSKKKVKSTESVMQELGLEDTDTTEVVDAPDFRADRLLLPSLVTKLAAFKPKDEICYKVNKGKISIKKI
ncbi:MAG: RimK family alpha-L-glutamate ligase [Candidatus Nanoarchaeia archaeon]